MEYEVILIILRSHGNLNKKDGMLEFVPAINVNSIKLNFFPNRCEVIYRKGEQLYLGLYVYSKISLLKVVSFETEQKSIVKINYIDAQSIVNIIVSLNDDFHSEK